MKIHMTKKEENCENIEEEVASLRIEDDRLNNKLKNSPVLDITGFGCIGDTSYK
jgi:hypothetical protein